MAAKRKKKNASKDQVPTYWVGLGASAGGLEALRGFVRNLPEDFDATYIVAQHMASHHKSMLVDIIGRETHTPVMEVQNGIAPQKDAIYIAPPNHNIAVHNGKLVLEQPSDEPGAPKPSVDDFFQSLAHEIGENAIGVILSGTGSDGAQGVREVKKRGGITIAQEALSAKYDGMPLAAVETGQVDLVFSSEEISARLPEIIDNRDDLSVLRNPQLSTDAQSKLVGLLKEKTNVDFSQYKSATFQRRVERRMTALNTPTVEQYVQSAAGSRTEVDKLFRDLLISVTSFFRDPQEFKSLEPIIRSIVERDDDQPIRVWIPGTATGEEAYSIAILFLEAVRTTNRGRGRRFQVFGTDLDKSAIEVARRGQYPKTALEQVDPEIRERYFDETALGFVAKKSLREKMVFSVHNLVQDPPFLNTDLISCRNLLIYFQTPLQEEALKRFHYSLRSHGVLFLGKSESVTAAPELFRTISGYKHIFSKKKTSRKITISGSHFELREPSLNIQSTRSIVSKEMLQSAEDRFDSLASALGQCALLIDGNQNILKAYGDVSAYTQVAAGNLDTRITTLLREPYLQDTKVSLGGILNKRTKSTGFSRTRESDPSVRERIDVYAVDDVNEEGMALVVFNEFHEDDEENSEAVEFSAEEKRLVDRRIEELNSELDVTKRSLQYTVEELETSNEELQAVNEQLQSSNEELQSTNEELETSNEELQSTNEELTTVNEELNVSASQLTSVNNSLLDIIRNVTFPLIVADRNQTITHASSSAETFFGLDAGAEGMHLASCSRAVGDTSITVLTARALSEKRAVTYNVRTGDEVADIKIVPHFSASGDLVGTIIMVIDNSAELKQARNELQLIFDNVPVALVIRDRDGTVLQANKHTGELLGVEIGNFVGSDFYSNFHKESAEKIRQGDRYVLDTMTPVLDRLVPVKLKDSKELWARVSRIPTSWPGREEPVLLSVTQDVSQQQKTQLDLINSERRLDQALKASGAGVWDWDIVADQVYWSPRMLEMLDIREKDLTKTLEDLSSRIHPDDLERVENDRNAHFQDDTPYETVYRIRKGKDDYIWVQSFGKVTRNEDGEPVRLTGAMMDITEERENRATVRQRNDQLELATELSGIGYWLVDLEAETVFWSERVYEIQGMRTDFVPTLDAGIDMYHPDDRPLVQKAVEEVSQGAPSFHFEARIVRPDGEERMVESIGRSDKDESGNVRVIFGVFRDITDDRKRERELSAALENLERSNEELSRFSYVCSHDLKEPVRMIEAMTAIIMDDSFEVDENTRKDMTARINSNTIRLKAIIDSLLAYSRLDSQIESVMFELGDVVDDVFESMALEIDYRNAKVSVASLPAVTGARVHFFQLFQNLLSNAVKFKADGKPKIEIKAELKGSDFHLQIHDNGPGVPDEHKKEIFEVFSRLERRDEIEGTGLGLSIVKRIVEQYKGNVECRDSHLGGAAFHIRFPRTLVEETKK